MYSALFHWFGQFAALVSFSSIVMDALAPLLPSGDSRSGAGKYIALTTTTVYCGMFTLHSQRKVLVALLSAFEFMFLSVPLTTVHVILCDFLG